MTSQKAWTCAGAAIRGAAHELHGTPCQDAWTAAQVDEVLYLAVADGAGTAKHAEIGSACAVEVALNEMIHLHNTWQSKERERDDMVKAVQIVLTKVHQHQLKMAEGEGNLPRDYASTLLMVIAGEGFTVAAQIGDGAVVGQASGEDTIIAMTKPEHGEYINVTSFVTDSDFLERCQITVIEQTCHGLAMFTDGLEPIAVEFKTGKPCKPLFEGLFNFARNLEFATLCESIINWLGGKKVGDHSDDDKTLVLACRPVIHNP